MMVVNNSIETVSFKRNKLFWHVQQAVVAAAMCTAIISPAVAQEEDKTSDRRSNASMLLEEVVVTAQKKTTAEGLQSVPIAVSAFSGSQLEAAFAEDLKDVGNMAPNVMLRETRTVPGTAAFYIRGSGTGQSIQSYQPAVGVFTDGIYLGLTSGSIPDVFDLESVEILRGPQGTLFGRNVTGGAVALRSLRPSGELHSKFKLGVGENALQTANAMIDMPIVDDTLAALVSISSKRSDGFVKNEFIPGDTLGEVDVVSGRAAFKYTPTDNFETTLILSDYENHGDGSPISVASDTSGYVGQDERPDFYTASNTFDSTSDQSIWSAILESNLDLEGGVATAVIGYRNVDVESYSDGDGRSAEVFRLNTRTKQDQTSVELRYAASPDWGSYTVGAFYWDSSLDAGELRIIAGGSTAASYAARGIEDNSAYALFGQTDIVLAKDFNLTLGARWNHETKDAKLTPFGACALTPNALGKIDLTSYDADACLVVVDDSHTWENVSPKVGLQYFFNDNMQMYTSLSSGFRSGSYNVRLSKGITSPDQVRPADPETTLSLDMGIKSSWLDGRLVANAALFRNEIKDFQQIALNPDVFQDIVNVGKAHTQGAELEIRALVTNNLAVTASGGYIDTFYDELNLLGRDEEEAKKWEFEKTPRVTSNMSVIYDISAGSAGDISLRAGYSFHSKMSASFDRIDNPNYFSAYEQWDASVTFTTLDDNLMFALSGKNLTDNESSENRFYVAGKLVQTLNPGRTWTASVEYRM